MDDRALLIVDDPGRCGAKQRNHRTAELELRHRHQDPFHHRNGRHAGLWSARSALECFQDPDRNGNDRRRRKLRREIRLYELREAGYRHAAHRRPQNDRKERLWGMREAGQHHAARGPQNDRRGRLYWLLCALRPHDPEKRGNDRRVRLLSMRVAD